MTVVAAPQDLHWAGTHLFSGLDLSSAFRYLSISQLMLCFAICIVRRGSARGVAHVHLVPSQHFSVQRHRCSQALRVAHCAGQCSQQLQFKSGTVSGMEGGWTDWLTTALTLEKCFFCCCLTCLFNCSAADFLAGWGKLLWLLLLALQGENAW